MNLYINWIIFFDNLNQLKFVMLPILDDEDVELMLYSHYQNDAILQMKVSNVAEELPMPQEILTTFSSSQLIASTSKDPVYRLYLGDLDLYSQPSETYNT